MNSMDLQAHHPTVDDAHEFSYDPTDKDRGICVHNNATQSDLWSKFCIHRGRGRYMLYLAQTCRMITNGGFFKNNVKGMHCKR